MLICNFYSVLFSTILHTVVLSFIDPVVVSSDPIL